jgi:hypothetical protein
MGCIMCITRKLSKMWRPHENFYGEGNFGVLWMSMDNSTIEVDRKKLKENAVGNNNINIGENLNRHYRVLMPNFIYRIIFKVEVERWEDSLILRRVPRNFFVVISVLISILALYKS